MKECTRVNLQLQTQVNGLNREVDKRAAQEQEAGVSDPYFKRCASDSERER